jgi:hypothetical protein
MRREDKIWPAGRDTMRNKICLFAVHTPLPCGKGPLPCGQSFAVRKGTFAVRRDFAVRFRSFAVR